VTVYRRDLDTGVVEHVSQPGVYSAGSTPSVSADGRLIAFSGAVASQSAVYVRDMQTGSFTVASRADGAGGTPAATANQPSMSPDGRFVAFTTPTALDAADTDGYADVYLRDLQNESTTLVSRASDAEGGADAEFPAEFPSVSADGQFVAFHSGAGGLAVPEEVYCTCIYVRDVAANTTELVSRASGELGAVPFNSSSTHARISGDGGLVVFQSQAQLHPEDTDQVSDAYIRDRATDTTDLLNRVSGAGGTAAEGAASRPVITPDGRFVAFGSASTNLTPDAGGCSCVFLRDLQAQENSLVSRATGAGGATPNGFAGWPAMPDDARFVAFESSATNLDPDDPDTNTDVYVREVQSETTTLEHRATPGYERYVRPKGATPFRVPLVPAVHQCGTPNREHGPPLAFGSCNPPGPTSPNLTMGVGDGSALFARGSGFLRMDVRLFAPAMADVTIRFSLTNVMKLDGTDYTGELRTTMQVRITDQYNGPSGKEEATVVDFPFPFTVPCAATESTLDGATCSLSTSAEAVSPGFPRRTKRTVHGLGQVQVFDGGPDGDAETTADNALFAVQGVFVP
jgi:Tol biopolymer transport system component